MHDINQWLDTLDLGQYTEVFAENDIDMEVLPELAEEDFEKLGVSMGHRKKLLKAIAALVAPEHEARPDAASQPATPNDSSIPPASPAPTMSRPAEAERRQLTVEFCDLVGSTALSGQLDPEDLRDVVRAYQEAAAAVIHRFEGHIAQYLGDGLLIYSGYPQAHEDDAHRAIRIGLGIVEAIEHLNPRLEQQYRVRLAVRVGIHTGPVVVGEMGGDERHEQLALGETPNIAARLEGLAASNQVVISAATRRLVGGVFELEDLGAPPMKGVAEPMQVYGVHGEGVVESRFEAATVTGLTPLVGREEEIGLVVRRWEQAKEGEGQVVLLCGEPGIGKSRLTQTARERVAEEPHIRVRYQCSPYYTNSVFYPIIAQLERAAQFTRDDTPDQKLLKLEALLGQGTAQVTEVAPLFATLLAIPLGDRYPPLALSPQRQKERTIEVLVDQLVGLARHQPVLFIWEDAHWSDPTSLDVLDLLIHRVADIPVLVVITYRPEFEPPWGGFAHVTSYTLNRLTRRQVVTLAMGVTGGKALPEVVLDQIAAKTDGVPLFVEELTKTVLESNLLHEAGDGYELIGPLPPLAIPTTLQDALMARLDRLAPVKEVAQIGAALGREFSYELVAAISPLQDTALQDALEQLVCAELLFRRGTPPEATYLFKHALVQDTAYESLLKSRRQQLHTQIAQVLEAHFPQTVQAEPELVAHHYTEADKAEEAAPYWLAAGQLASARASTDEATEHLKTGLAVLKSLTESTRRADLELQLQSALGFNFVAKSGYGDPEVAAVFAEAERLLQDSVQGPDLCPILYGMGYFYWVSGNTHKGIEKFEQLLGISEASDNSDLLMIAYQAISSISFNRANFKRAVELSDKVMQSYDAPRHAPLRFVYGQDIFAAAVSFVTGVHAHLGSFNLAIERAEAAIAHARTLSHPFSLAHALAMGGYGLAFSGMSENVLTWSNECIELGDTQGLPFWGAWGYCNRGAMARYDGRPLDAIEDLQRGLDILASVGGTGGKPGVLNELALACIETGQLERAEEVLKETEGMLEARGEFLQRPLTALVRGQLVMAGNRPQCDEAAQHFQLAIRLAREQGSKLEEIRAATSLARLWQSQGKLQEARDLLTPVYSWFTEGFDTADLKEAKVLLAELEG